MNEYYLETQHNNDLDIVSFDEVRNNNWGQYTKLPLLISDRPDLDGKMTFTLSTPQGKIMIIPLSPPTSVDIDKVKLLLIQMTENPSKYLLDKKIT